MYSLRKYCYLINFIILPKYMNVQSTLPKSTLHKSNNRLSRRSIQVLFSLYSIVLTPHKSNFL